MISLWELGNVNPIFLSVSLIFYLILVELGNKKMKRILLPVVIALIVVFCVVAAYSVVQTWTRLK